MRRGYGIWESLAVAEVARFCCRAAALDSTVVAVVGAVAEAVGAVAEVACVGIAESADCFDSTAEDKI